MKRFIAAMAVALLSLSFTQPVQAATSGSKTVKQSKHRSSAKKPASKTRRKSKTSNCTSRRVKTSKGWRTVRKCSSNPDRVLSSPIDRNALEKGPEPDEPGKIRSAPERAYAVDGESFFYQGRKYRVAGLEDSETSDMARQRLQKQLESGPLEIETLSAGAEGVSTAQVRINGRNLVDLLK